VEWGSCSSRVSPAQDNNTKTNQNTKKNKKQKTKKKKTLKQSKLKKCSSQLIIITSSSMSFSCEFVERRIHPTIAECVQRHGPNTKKKWSRYYLAEEGTGEKRGGGFGRFNRTTQQSDPVMRSAALVGKMPQRNRKTEFTYRLFAIRGGPEQCRGIDRRRGNFPYSIVCTQQSSLKKKNTRLVNRGRNDTVVCLVVFFFSPVSAVLQGRGGGV
jgi:hypothetical protein